MRKRFLVRLGKMDETTWLVASITLVAFLVRVWGIDFGLPYIYNTDEAWFVNYAMAIGATWDSTINPLGYPPFLMYILFVLYGIYFVFGSIIGVFGSIDDFAISFFQNPTPFYLLGRGFATLLATATVSLVYILGKKVYNRHTGVVAAIFMAFALEHAVNSHYIKTQVPLTFLSVLSVMLAYQMWQRGSFRDYAVAWVAAGLSAGMLQPGIFLLVPVAVAHLFRVVGQDADCKRRLLGPKAAIGAAFWMLGLFIGNPPLFLDFGSFLASLRAMSAVYSGGDAFARGPLGHVLLLGYTMGPLLAIFAVAGIIHSLIRRRPEDMFLLCFPIVNLLFFSLYKAKVGYHLLPIHPFLALFAAEVLVCLTAEVHLKKVRQDVLVVGLILLTVLLPAVRIINWDRRISQTDTRTLAKDWIEDNIPAGSRILLDSGKYYVSAFSPPLQDSKKNLQEKHQASLQVDYADTNKWVDGRRVNLPYASEYYRYVLAATSGITYDLIRVLHDGSSDVIDVQPLDYYQNEGVQYSVVSGKAYRAYYDPEYPFPKKAEAYRRFYDSLEKEAILLKEFQSSPRPGPTIKIYRLNDEL